MYKMKVIRVKSKKIKSIRNSITDEEMSVSVSPKYNGFLQNTTQENESIIQGKPHFSFKNTIDSEHTRN